MLFNQPVFFAFFVVVYGLYLALRGRYRWQNFLLLIASYVYYAWWDWRFLSLIIISTIVDFTVGRLLAALEDERQRRGLLAISVAVNLGLLGIFKYFNFFALSLADSLTWLGIPVDPVTLNIVLPVGISFYTFQTMSYIIDVYRRQIPATSEFLTFAVFVAFFPQLVAGPIERASNLIPQFTRPRTITAEQWNTGIYLVISGLFKKMVIADQVAVVANTVFNNYLDYAGIDIVLGVLAFTLQIYCDFSGYSDIARGIARFMGFELMVNFRLPFFALNPSDFWNRWHISLSTWLRDYLYIPLGGNRHGQFNTYRNLFLTMLLGGLWHGAAWNFVLWGVFHGVILILFRIFDREPLHLTMSKSKTPVFPILLRMFSMFVLMCIGWLLFRAESWGQIVYMFTHIGFSTSASTISMLERLVILWFPMIVVQVVQYVSTDLLVITRLPLLARIGLYGLAICSIIIYGVRETSEFIYFAF